MKPHKWAKEIKAWADGAEIEYCVLKGKWRTDYSPTWIIDDEIEYRIKPQEQQSCCCCKQTCSAPKEPQYLYVYFNKQHHDVEFVIQKYKPTPPTFLNYVGKIKLEQDE